MTFLIRSTEGGPDVAKTDVLDLLGVCCVALFAYAIWPAACLLVMGAAALLMSWRASR